MAVLLPRPLVRPPRTCLANPGFPTTQTHLKGPTMARRPLQGGVNQRVETAFNDEFDDELHTMEYREELRNENGTVTTVKRATNISLVTGEAYSPSMSAGAKPVLLVGVCALCRRRRSFLPWRRRPVVPLANAKKLRNCASCGRAVCPRHCRRSKYDRRWRCRPHHFWHVMRTRWLMPLFYERIEE